MSVFTCRAAPAARTVLRGRCPCPSLDPRGTCSARARARCPGPARCVCRSRRRSGGRTSGSRRAGTSGVLLVVVRGGGVVVVVAGGLTGVLGLLGLRETTPHVVHVDG